MAGLGMIVVGDLVTDVLVVVRDPIEAGTDTAAAIAVGGGGQGANTAAWAVHAGLADVTLVAAVGDDTAGRERTAELTAAGVDCRVQVHAGAPTGSVVVLSGDGERTMITDRGASLLLDPAFVQAAVAAVPATHLHLSGYVLLNGNSRPAGLAALASAQARGLTTSVDAASVAPLRSAGPENFLAWVRGTDLLLCNADEAAVLGGAGVTAYASNVIVKNGAAGATWSTAARRDYAIGGRPVRAQDTTGAGDAFAAGLLHAWLGGASPLQALAAGAELGAAAVGRHGARPPLP